MSRKDSGWSLLRSDLACHTANGDSISYRDTRLKMAALAFSEKRYQFALNVYLEIAYRDLDGRGQLVCSSVYEPICEISKALHLDLSDIKNVWDGGIATKLALPTDQGEAWEEISGYLSILINQ